MHNANSQLLLHDSPVTTEFRKILRDIWLWIHYYHICFLKRLLLMILWVKLNMFTFEWLSVFGRQMVEVFKLKSKTEPCFT